MVTDYARIAMRTAGGRAASEGPIEVHIEARFSIPKSFSKKRREAAYALVEYPHRPDLDQVVKSALDAMNGVVFYDDHQVVNIQATKSYGRTGFLFVFVRHTWEWDNRIGLGRPLRE